MKRLSAVLALTACAAFAAGCSSSSPATPSTGTGTPATSTGAATGHPVPASATRSARPTSTTAGAPIERTTCGHFLTLTDPQRMDVVRQIRAQLGGSPGDDASTRSGVEVIAGYCAAAPADTPISKAYSY
ncbi:hypothetical protein G4X40_15440 [Rhodococcus sp. D2-41]|uniref:DUF732 domain-containing protein n=1 Tax=Speluncibacter jeojiensis TaxID=2710754 RepID=A0A9X4LZ96_9ACTN|nr:hypothetical protein [Rhodococcus sp. D2-41]MDG3011539.1 hypothetical protein [Rhodococcus sp. D2-41]MDG3015103.1 hypothetical protein [Corynebacteriales bacterium D3-21]